VKRTLWMLLVLAVLVTGYLGVGLVVAAPLLDGVLHLLVEVVPADTIQVEVSTSSASPLP
jgi:hypothetical protein